MNIFRHSDYKDILRVDIAGNSDKRGYQSRLAKACGCQRSYFSQVLSKSHHLTLEHGTGLAIFWNLSDLETEYFLDLISLAKAGTRQLRERLEKRLQRTRDQSQDLSKRLRIEEIEIAAQQLYYSSWKWSAVHIALSVPGLRRIQDLAVYLGLESAEVELILNGLVNIGLVVNEEGQWKTLRGSAHLPKDSPLIRSHHGNWRQRALLHGPLREEEFQFSSALTVSKKDIEVIRKVCLDVIETVSELVRESEPEELCCLNVDFLSLGRR